MDARSKANGDKRKKCAGKTSMALDNRFRHLQEERLKLEQIYETSTSKIQTVSSYLREREEYEKFYLPKLISFGPIHHGDPKLKRGEQYKLMWASMYAEASRQTPQYLYKKIANHIKELRGLFLWEEIGHVDDHYSDEDLAWMLFVDGCSVLQILEKANSKAEDLKVKIDTLVIIERDLFLLENQLPYQLLKLLSKDELKLKISVYGYCELQNMFTVLGSPQSRLSREPMRLMKTLDKSSPPTHLLDCLRTSILSIGMESTDKDEPEHHQTEEKEHSSPPTHILNALRTSIFAIFMQGFPIRNLQNMFTLRKAEHETGRGKRSSLPMFEREIERGKQSSPPAILEPQTEREYRRSVSRHRWRQAVLLVIAQIRYRFQISYLDIAYTYANSNKKEYTSYRNIQELKATTLKVKRQKNISLKNISFSSSLIFGGKLHLPPLILNDSTVPILLNLAAYETCPDFINEFEISSYIKLLDLLIDEREDVKELRSSGILHNSLGCDEEVVKLFNTISSGLVHNPILYSEIKDKVEKHYKNKFHILMAGAYYTYFKTPWSFVASSAAVSALVLTALQTWKAF